MSNYKHDVPAKGLITHEVHLEKAEVSVLPFLHPVAEFSPVSLDVAA